MINIKSATAMAKRFFMKNFADAEKLAIETYKKFEKFNKSFEG